MLQPMGVDASGGQAEENRGENDSDEVEDIPHQPIEPRRSGRIRVPSQRALENIRLSINLFRSDKVTKSHEHMVRVLATLARDEDNEGLDEPLTLKEAMSSSHWEQWKKAMEAEYQSLMENETWILETAPLDRKVITRRKKDRDGKVLKYKARWVVHGYKQKEGLDYLDTFAIVVKPVSYKKLIRISVKRGLTIHHMDVVTAFLYGFLDGF